MFTNEWTFLNSKQFPEKAQLYKRVKPKNVEDDYTYKGAEVFNYRMVAKDDGTYQPIKGLKRFDKEEFRIEVADNIEFEPGSIIEFYNNKDYRFTIVKVEIKIDNRNEQEYNNIASDWPGIINSTHIKMITLV